MTIHIRQSHNLSVARAKAAVNGLGFYIRRYGVELDWFGPSAILKGRGVSGDIQVTESEVVVCLANAERPLGATSKLPTAAREFRAVRYLFRKSRLVFRQR